MKWGTILPKTPGRYIVTIKTPFGRQVRQADFIKSGRKTSAFRPRRMSTLVLFFRYAPNDARHELTLQLIRSLQFPFLVSGLVGFHQGDTL